LENRRSANCWLRAYRKGETFGTAFARLYTRVFAEMVVVFLNPLDQSCHRIAQPVFRAALESSEEINQALVARKPGTGAAGYTHRSSGNAVTHAMFLF